MEIVKSCFWNQSAGRLRAFWRILSYLLIVALLVNPVVLLTDHLFEPALTPVSINFIVAVGFFFGLVLFLRFIDKGDLVNYGIIFKYSTLVDFIKGVGLGALMVVLVVVLLLLFDQINYRESLYVSKEFELGFIWVLMGQLLRYLFGSIFEEIMSRAFLIKHLSEGIRWPGKMEIPSGHMDRMHHYLSDVWATPLDQPRGIIHFNCEPYPHRLFICS